MMNLDLLSIDEQRQLSLVRVRLVMQHEGFTRYQTDHLVFMRWMYLSRIYK